MSQNFNIIFAFLFAFSSLRKLTKWHFWEKNFLYVHKFQQPGNTKVSFVISFLCCSFFSVFIIFHGKRSLEATCVTIPYFLNIAETFDNSYFLNKCECVFVTSPILLIIFFSQIIYCLGG